MKKITLLIVLLLTAGLGFGQTTLLAGDIAITGFNTNPDKFSFVLLTNVSSSTTINFTDNGWLSSGSFRGGEGTITWTATSDLPCGIEIVVTDNSPFSVNYGAITDSGGFNLAATGDQIIGYQGLESSPNILYAIDFDSAVWADNIDSSNTSSLPTGLIDGTTALDLGETDNGTYGCAVTSVPSLILAGISTTGNWTTSNSLIPIGGCYYSCATCTDVAVWNGGWTPSAPTSSSVAVINGDYTTSIDGNINACSLIVNANLTVDDGYFVEVENDVTLVSGNLNIETQGAFVQRGVGAAAGTFTIIGGTANVNKTTRTYFDAGLHYVYWGSPVASANITTTFPNPDKDRRYSFSGQNFLDENINSTGLSGQDDIDDNDNDWQTASGNMLPGHGYAVTTVAPPPVPGPISYNDAATFSGQFNTGDISVIVYRNDDELNDVNWNLLGNPYPSAISTDDFFAENGYDATLNPTGALEGLIYLWTHNSLASASNPGNQGYNFSLDDYAMINKTLGIQAISGGATPSKFIPSGQGFFARMSNDATSVSGTFPNYSSSVKFTNAMRMADGTSNSQFFKNSQTKKQSEVIDNKLWINLISDNGIFNQAAVGYISSATNADDGLSYDAERLLFKGTSAIIYTTIADCNKRFAIQGKDSNSINEDEIIQFGFKTSIDVATVYSISIDHVEGSFLSNNTIYLKDNLLNKLHNLTDSDYTFTSEVGEFNQRFEIVFNANALSVNDITADTNALKIVELQDNRVQFSISNGLRIENIKIYDLLGRQLYNLNGSRSVEVFNLSNLNHTVYIAKVQLSNGALITKKAIKR